MGIPRREFLYDVEFWEARRIIRGYKRRNILQYQLMRLQSYYACFAMRENKSGKSPQDWLPLYFDKEMQEDTPPMSVEEYKELKEEIDYFNSISPEEFWGGKSEG